MEIRFAIGERRYSVDGGQRLMDAAPFVKEGRTYVPVRYLAEPMGARVNLPEGKQAGLYLLARAIVGPKPVVGFPDIFVLARLSPRDHGLWRHWLAEALAARATPMPPYETFTQGGGSFTLPAGEIAPYTRFLRARCRRWNPTRWRCSATIRAETLFCARDHVKMTS